MEGYLHFTARQRLGRQPGVGSVAASRPVTPGMEATRGADASLVHRSDCDRENNCVNKYECVEKYENTYFF